MEAFRFAAPDHDALDLEAFEATLTSQTRAAATL